MIDAWQNEDEAARCFNTEQPLTRPLDLREEGLAMQATRVCSVTDCDRPHRGRDLCGMHYQRFMKTGTTEAAPKRRAACSIAGCDGPARARGWCGMHWARWSRTGDPELARVGSAALPGDQNCKWQGDDIGYGTAHERVRAVRGPAHKLRCVDCGQGATSWSYDHLDPDERVDPKDPKRKPYSVNVDRYQPRCPSCHWKIDHPTGKVTRS